MVGHPQNHIIQVSSSSFEKTRTFSFLTLTVPFPSETSSSSGANECRFAPCRFGTAPWPLSLSLSHVHVHVQSAWLCLSDVSGSNTCIFAIIVVLLYIRDLTYDDGGPSSYDSCCAGERRTGYGEAYQRYRRYGRHVRALARREEVRL